MSHSNVKVLKILDALNQSINQNFHIPMVLVPRDRGNIFNVPRGNTKFDSHVSDIDSTFINVHGTPFDNPFQISKVSKKFAWFRKTALLHKDLTTHTDSFDITVNTLDEMIRTVDFGMPTLSSYFSQYENCWSLTFRQWNNAILQKIADAESLIGVCVHCNDLPEEAKLAANTMATSIESMKVKMLRMPVGYLASNYEFRILCLSGNGAVSPNAIRVLPGYTDNEEEKRGQKCSAAFFSGIKQCPNADESYTRYQLYEDPDSGELFCETCHELGIAKLRQ